MVMRYLGGGVGHQATRNAVPVIQAGDSEEPQIDQEVYDDGLVAAATGEDQLDGEGQLDGEDQLEGEDQLDGDDDDGESDTVSGEYSDIESDTLAGDGEFGEGEDEGISEPDGEGPGEDSLAMNRYGDL
jgi:hypothetical protein